MTDSRALIVELVIAAPVDTVWKALRDPAAITQWFGWNHPDLPAEIEYIFVTHAVADEPRRELTIDKDVVTLEARGEQTILRVTRAAPAAGSWDEIYDEVVEGWRTFMQQLRYTLEQHPDEARRTVYLSGRARRAGATPPSLRGLDGLAAAAADDAYAITAATGDALAGRVWFRSARQTGVTVDAFGHGLLVGMRRPPTDASPFGGGMVVLTLYGFDDAAHAALIARWHAWFEANFDKATLHT